MKYFFDAGAHLLESVDYFKNKFLYSQDYNVFSFEPAYDGDIKDEIDSVIRTSRYEEYFRSFHFLPVAVASKSALLPFYRDRSYSLSESSSLEAEKGRTSGLNELRLVPALRLSDILRNYIKDSDYCILKIDIEGSEYDLIDDLYSTGQLKRVNQIYLELHDYRLRKDDRRDKRLFYQLQEFGLTARSWDAATIANGKPDSADHNQPITLSYINRLHSRY